MILLSIFEFIRRGLLEHWVSLLVLLSCDGILRLELKLKPVWFFDREGLLSILDSRDFFKESFRIFFTVNCESMIFHRKSRGVLNVYFNI